MRKLLFVAVLIIILLVSFIIYAAFYLGFLPPFSSTSNSINLDNIDLTKETKVEEVATGLEIPWAIVLVGENKFLVTERTGKIKIIENKKVSDKLALDLSQKIVAVGEAGLMSMVADPNFDDNHYVYVYHTYKNSGEVMLKVSRYEFENDKLENEFILISSIPSGNVHSGGELAFGPDGKLYITTGDVAQADLAQDLNSLAGKTLRINKDGSVPSDNPFAKNVESCKEVKCFIWSYGHRNAQGLDWHPTTYEMYQSEHGPSGFDGGVGMDEINLVRRGQNYGWPTIRGDETKPGMQSPLKIYTPAIAPSSVAFYSGEMFPELEGKLLVGALRGEALLVLEVDGSSIKSENRLINDAYGRIREVKIGPDGSIYFTTSNRDGRGNVREEDDKVIRIYKD